MPLQEIRWYNSAKKQKQENKLYYFSKILCYSQTCSNDHVYKTTTRLDAQCWIPPGKFP